MPRPGTARPLRCSRWESIVNVHRNSSLSLRILDTPFAVWETRSMKLTDDAKQMGVRYETAWRWFRDGKIQGRRIGLHTIMITEGQEQSATAVSQRVAVSRRVAVYARVSSSENQSTLDRQAKRLVVFCAARGYQVAKVITEIGSGINDARPKLLA